MSKGQVVSVIVTTKNEEEVIGRLIKSVKGQSYKYKEIIVVDNNSWDRTIKIAKGLGALIYNFGPERSAQRNYGVKKSNGEYLLFLDADMELSKDVVWECVNLMSSDKKLGALVIPENSLSKNFWEQVKAFERSFYNEQGDEITDAVRFFSKKVFKKIGGYDEKITGPEDWDITDRVKKTGYKIASCKSVIYHHERIPTLFSLLQKKFYYALKSHRYLAKQKISVFGPKTIYFLRPVFYKRFDKILSHPLLSLGMFIVLSLEQLAAGSGYILGRIKKA